MSGEASKIVSPGGDLLERAVARYHEILASIDTAESVAFMRESFERANGGNAWKETYVRAARHMQRHPKTREDFRHAVIGYPAPVGNSRVA